MKKQLIWVLSILIWLPDFSYASCLSELNAAYTYHSWNTCLTRGDRTASRWLKTLRKNPLSSSEQKACDYWLIRSYTGDVSGAVNRVLRGREENPPQECVDFAEETKRATSLLPSFGWTVTFRGLTGFKTLNDLRVGECFSDRAFMSTSVSITTAERFADPISTGLILQIQSHSGKDVSSVSAYEEEEKEILLLPGTVLRLQQITAKTAAEFRRLYFTEVDAGECEVIRN